MGCISVDLTIAGALSDPMIAAVMRADHVDPQWFEHLLVSAARDLDGARRPRRASLGILAERVRDAVAGTPLRW